MKRERGWAFGYPEAMGGSLSGQGLARLRLALGLLFPPLRWPRRRVADLPASLRCVACGHDPAGRVPRPVGRAFRASARPG